MAQSGKIPGSKRALRRAKKVDRNKRSKMIRYRYLIACEGKETEPNYFTALSRQLPKDIAIIAKGDGRNTLSLIEWAKQEKNRYEADFMNIDEVWIVMDRDSFPADKFNNAIKSAEAKGYKVAWSNECFELWFLLHFKAVNHAMSRKDIYNALSEIFNFNYERHGKAKDIYMTIRKCGGSEECAMKRAAELWLDKNIISAKANPATGVFELVKKLNKYADTKFARA